MTVYDQHGFRVLFHFARDPLPGRSDVLVVVVSMLSTAPQPIRNIVFQSAVPKVTWVCLSPQSRVIWGWMWSQLSGAGGRASVSLRESEDRREPKGRALGPSGWSGQEAGFVPEGLGTRSQGWLSPICPLTFHRS